MRAFIALRFDETFVRGLARLRDAAFPGAPLRRDAEADLHATLAFLGEIDPARAAAAADICREAAASFPPFRVDCGSWLLLPPRRPRVLAARVGRGAGEAAALAEAIEDGLEAAGRRGLPFRPREGRPFLAHVTVARAARPPLRLGDAGAAFPPAAGRALSLALMVSLDGAGGRDGGRGTRGVRYREEAAYPLAGPERGGIPQA